MRKLVHALFIGIFLWNAVHTATTEAGNRRVQKSDLPVGSEFSRSQIDLAEVLELAKTHGADWRAFEASVWDRYFKAYAASEENP